MMALQDQVLNKQGGEDYGGLESTTLPKDRSHKLALINCCHVGPVLSGLRFFFKRSQKPGFLSEILFLSIGNSFI